MLDKSVYGLQPFYRQILRLLIFLFGFMAETAQVYISFYLRLCLGGLFLHHNNTKKIFAVAGVGIAAAAIATGLYMHMKKHR